MTTDQRSLTRSTFSSTAGKWLVRIWRSFEDALTSTALLGDDGAARLRRIRFIGALGVIGHPLYFIIWVDIFPQPYENIWLRLLAMTLFIPLLFATSLAKYKWLPFYELFAITVGLPFVFFFFYLENGGSMVWAESSIIAISVLFHFGLAFALISLVAGATGAATLFVLAGNPVSASLWPALLIQLPIVGFMIAMQFIVVKLNRQILAEEKRRGMEAALGTVAHELRTPLASLALTAQGIERRLAGLTQEDHPDVRALKQATERMRSDVMRATNSIELLVANSKDPQTVSINWFDPHEAICSAIAAFPFEPGTRELVSIAPSIGVRVLGNASLFEHIVTNLTKNALEAIQRVGKGDLHISYEQSLRAIEIVVRDTGSGISSAVLKRMFQPFFSYPAHRGTGIGLMFCRKVLHSWSASISCRSIEHEYTEFRIRFPNPR